MNQSTLAFLPGDKEAALYRKAVEEGLASLDAKKGIPYEQVRDWLLSWGAKGEL